MSCFCAAAPMTEHWNAANGGHSHKTWNSLNGCIWLEYSPTASLKISWNGASVWDASYLTLLPDLSPSQIWPALWSEGPPFLQDSFFLSFTSISPTDCLARFILSRQQLIPKPNAAQLAIEQLYFYHISFYMVSFRGKKMSSSLTKKFNFSLSFSVYKWISENIVSSVSCYIKLFDLERTTYLLGVLVSSTTEKDQLISNIFADLKFSFSIIYLWTRDDTKKTQVLFIGPRSSSSTKEDVAVFYYGSLNMSK